MPVPTTIFEGSILRIYSVFVLDKDVRKGRVSVGRQNSDCQTSGRPWYAVRLGCRSDEEPRYCLLEFDAWIVGEAGRVGYVLGSEGSWEHNNRINHGLVRLHEAERKKKD
jgi:hypothetical protein